MCFFNKYFHITMFACVKVITRILQTNLTLKQKFIDGPLDSHCG